MSVIEYVGDADDDSSECDQKAIQTDLVNDWGQRGISASDYGNIKKFAVHGVDRKRLGLASNKGCITVSRCTAVLGGIGLSGVDISSERRQDGMGFILSRRSRGIIMGFSL